MLRRTRAHQSPCDRCRPTSMKATMSRLPVVIAIGVCLSRPALSQEFGGELDDLFGTRSIVACDLVLDACGVAVVSFPSGTPYVVPLGQPGIALANQGIPSLQFAKALMQRISQGVTPADALSEVGPSTDVRRQIGVATIQGGQIRVANVTGDSVPPERCALTGSSFSVQANTQTNGQICEAMATAFERSSRSFPFRLLQALTISSGAGGDIRGEYSAAIFVFSDTWARAQFSNVSAGATVTRSGSWQRDLEWDLTAHLGFSAPSDVADLVPLDSHLVMAINRALRELGYLRGDLSTVWTPDSEAALAAFQRRNINFAKPTVVQGDVHLIDLVMASYLLEGTIRRVLQTAGP